MDAPGPFQPSPPTSVPLPLPPLAPIAGAPAWSPGYPLQYFSSFPAPQQPRVWTVFVVFLVALVAAFGAGTVVLVIALFAHYGAGAAQTGEEMAERLKEILLRPSVLLASGAATQLVLLAIALSAAALSPQPLVARLRLNRSTLSPLGYILVLLGGLSISFLFEMLAAMLKIKEQGTLKALGDVIRQLSPAQMVLAVLVIGVGPGFGEEFLFRGYMQTRLSRRWGRWIAIVICSVLFGVMHMDLVQGTFACLFGLFIGYVAERCGSIRPTMACHMFNNSVQVIVGRYASEGGTELAAAMVAAAAVIVLLTSIAYLVFVVPPPPALPMAAPDLPIGPALPAAGAGQATLPLPGG